MSHIIHAWATDGSWWTEAHAAWTEAFALFLIFFLDLVLGYFDLRERKETRRERRHAEVTRQRSEVTCAGITSVLRSVTETDLCRNLWTGHFRHAGFAIDKLLYHQLPEYLQRKCEPYIDEIGTPLRAAQHDAGRFLLVFQFPYPNYDAVLTDVNRLKFGQLPVVWDENGNPIPIKRD